MITIDVLSIFPNLVSYGLDDSIIKRAIKKRLVEINIHNIRDFATDKHKLTDDTPYGGGAGMVMLIEPIDRAIQKLRRDNSKVVLLSPKGKQWKQSLANKYAKEIDHIILICARYEGIDNRVEKYLVDELISIGPYILSGGEPAAIVMIDSLVRLVPNVLGNQSSLENETNIEEGYKKYPVFTKPEKYTSVSGEVWKVPEILRSGHHKKIEEWREENA